MDKIVEKIKRAFNGLRFAEFDGALYLTDSKLLIRLIGATLPNAGDYGMIHKEQIVKVWSNATESAESALIEKVCALAATPIPCQKCKGSGFVYQCSECYGDGECFCIHCDQTYTCKICNGSGISGSKGKQERCEDCDGSGQQFQSVSALGKRYNLNYLRLIADIAPGAIIFKPVAKAPTFFKSDKISGLLMDIIQ